MVLLELAQGGPGELELRHVLALVGAPEVHEAGGLGVWKGPEEGGVDGGEDGGIEADAHREREHDDCREAGSGAEVTAGVTEVLE